MSDPAGALAGMTPEQKRAMLAKLLRDKARKARRLPASYAQRTLWALEQMAPGRATYNMHAAVRIEGPLDPDVFARAVNEIVRRHESLRTTFEAVDGDPWLVIAPELRLEVPVVDLRALDESGRKGQARRIATEETRRPFDLAVAPLFRVKVLRLGDAEFVTLLTLHHINADGWSVQIFLRELVAIYDAFARGAPSPLPDPPIQYADYAEWQRGRIDGGGARESLDYWTGRLAGVAPLDLPTDRPRPAVQTLRGAIRPFRFPPALGEAIRALSRREQCTPFMTLLAALNVLLHHTTGQHDIPIGSPYANRTRKEVEGLIGYFVNMLVLRVDLADDPTFVELLGRVRAVVLGAIKHQDVPFSKVVEELRIARDPSRHPLFQVMFVYQNTPRAEANLDSLRLTLGRQPTEGGTGASKFELTLTMTDARKGLKGRFQYNTDLYDAATIDRMIEHLQAVLEGIVADPSRRVSELPLLDAPRRKQLLDTWAAPRRAAPPNACVHRDFERQAGQTPAKVALVHDDVSMTYRELDRSADRLARHLRGRGVAAETPVALLMDRRPEMIVGLLAILKSGGVYVPIDPSQPRERVRSILADCRARVVVTLDAWRPLVAPLVPEVVALDADGPAIAGEEPGAIPAPAAVALANLAALFYTSGTTGRPKGVMIEHGALAHYTAAATAEYAIQPADRVLQFASIGFDASLEEIFPCLTRGGTLVLRNDAMLDSHAGFLAACAEREITVLSLPTAYWHELCPALRREGLTVPEGLRLAIIGGEAALPARVAEWRQSVGPTTRLLNTYGPTEATVVATSCDLTDLREAATVPIGRPLANVRAYVLDPHGRPSPVGIPGALWLGGPGLARGYWDQPGATAERFTPDPFSDRPGDRLYRTGDRVRWRPDGQLEYLGRIDDQVKIRGQRVEPAEVETTLLAHPSVRDAAVLALDDSRGGRRLVAYLVPSGPAPPPASELRGFLRQRLPEAMVPSSFVTLDLLPRSPAGKVDRRALPAPADDPQHADASYREPATPTERTLAAIWSEVLGRDRCGTEESFFDLGGHSLLAIRVAARVREAFQVELPVQRFFLAPTIAGLARVIDDLARSPTRGSSDRPGFDLEAEGTLDPKVRPSQPSAPFQADPARVLLTGATGFLGAYLLRDLLRETRAEVACLVRCSDAAEGARRLRDALTAYGLWDDDLAGRIVPVPGDLARPRFGLSDLEFERLADGLDVLYHNGALVNSLYPYEMLRDINVLGTQDVLRLAATGATKAVHFVSTLSVLKAAERSAGDAGVLREADPLGPGSGLRGGYVQSKWVAERLMTAARARGIPVSVYRPGRIAGDSRTGACNTNDFLFLMLRNVRRTGKVPALKGRANLVPVDFVSRAIVHLASRPESRDRTFHLLNPSPLPIPELIECVRSLGAAVRPVSPDDWRKELQALSGTGAGPASTTLALRPARTRPASGPARATIDWRNTREGLAGSGIACPPVDASLIATYYSYLVRNGLLDDD